MVYFHSFLLFSTFLLFYWNPLLGIGGMVCCSKWWRTSQAPAAVGSPSSFDINTFHNCAPTKRYRRKQLESFKWLWVLAMCQREYFLEYDFWLWMFWEIFRRYFCEIFQRTVGPICEQFTKGVWEIAALAEGYVLLAIKWGSNVSAEKHPFYCYYLFRYIMRVFNHALVDHQSLVCLQASFWYTCTSSTNYSIVGHFKACYHVLLLPSKPLDMCRPIILKTTCYMPPNYS